MTYEELFDDIFKMTAEQKAQTITIYIQGGDEYFPVENLIFFEKENDVLDKDHPILIIQ